MKCSHINGTHMDSSRPKPYGLGHHCTGYASFSLDAKHTTSFVSPDALQTDLSCVSRCLFKQLVWATDDL
eukprot:scaffold256413_cov19-Prasinocladus_malaysianus.AAC.1